MSEFKYGTGSRRKLDTCHPVLQRIAVEALRLSPYDITLIHGWRGLAEQNILFKKEVSTKRFPDSRHNKTDDEAIRLPDRMSDALDFGPYIDGDIPWGDTHIFAVVAGCFMAAAAGLGYTLRWGGDWDSDGTTTDQKLMDWGHIEIVWG